MTIRPGVEVAELSDIGCRRESNEDSHAYWEPESEAEFLRKGRLAVVADGMGGLEGGKEASRIAVETVVEAYASATEGDARSQLVNAFRAAHLGIRQFARRSPILDGMGTTCTAAVLLGSSLYYAHVGDSRLYRLRGSTFQRLTRDDSFVERLVEHGLIRPDEAATHPQKNVLTAALGVGVEIVPQSSTQPVEVVPEDTFVLCTDGLWSMVREEELCRLVCSEKPAKACRKLVQLALDRGGPDNITVQILRVSE